jgi:hypothetical protein
MISQDLAQSQDCQLDKKILLERESPIHAKSYAAAMGEVGSERKKAAIQKEIDG